MRDTTQTCQGTATEACYRTAHFTVYKNRTGSFRVDGYEPRGIYCQEHAEAARDRKNAERSAE